MRQALLWAGAWLAVCGPPAEAAEPRGFVGAGAGRSHLKAEFTGDGLRATIDRDETAYKVFGGARFGILGFEGGYLDLGHPEGRVGGTAVKVDLAGFEGFATLNVKAGPVLLFAKGGALNWKAEARVDGFEADRSGTSVAWGAGASVRLTQHISARAEYEKFDVGTLNDFHLWTAGVELTF